MSFCSQALRRSINRNGSKVICVFHLVCVRSMAGCMSGERLTGSSTRPARDEVRNTAEICFQCKKQLSLFQTQRWESPTEHGPCHVPCVLERCFKLATRSIPSEVITASPGASSSQQLDKHSHSRCHSSSAAAVRKSPLQKRLPWQRPS